MSVYILIHGAFHGGWCWERVTPLIESAGHRALAPDLPGMGGDRTPFSADPLTQWADAIAALVEAQQEPVILVGHSLGGVILSLLAERMPERIARLVYVTALILRDGDTLLGGQDINDVDADPNSFVRLSEDGSMTYANAANAADLFYTQLSDADKAAAMARLTGQPLALLHSRLRLTPERFGRVPRAYIEATCDRALPLDIQRAMQVNAPCETVIALPSDHSPFYSMPERLTEALLSLA